MGDPIGQLIKLMVGIEKRVHKYRTPWIISSLGRLSAKRAHSTAGETATTTIQCKIKIVIIITLLLLQKKKNTKTGLFPFYIVRVVVVVVVLVMVEYLNFKMNEWNASSAATHNLICIISILKPKSTVFVGLCVLHCFFFVAFAVAENDYGAEIFCIL